MSNRNEDSADIPAIVRELERFAESYNARCEQVRDHSGQLSEETKHAAHCPRYHLAVLPQGEARAAWRAYCRHVPVPSFRGFERAYAGEFTSLTAYARHALDSCGCLPEHLAECFDFQAYADRLIAAHDIFVARRFEGDTIFIFRTY